MSIQVKELMVGNWVLLNKEPQIVYGWMFIQETKNMSPIPLTVELLIKCGFRENTFGQGWL